MRAVRGPRPNLLSSKRLQPSFPERAESGSGERTRGHLLEPCCWEPSPARAVLEGRPKSLTEK